MRLLNLILKKVKKKYNEIQIKMIKELVDELKDHQNQMKVALLELKKKNINISSQTLKKIITETY